jgi:hypothetical protein
MPGRSSGQKAPYIRNGSSPVRGPVILGTKLRHRSVGVCRFLLPGGFSVALIAGAADAAEFIYMGHGTRSCSSWTIDRRAPSITKIADEAWILGFLSGVGATSDLALNPLKDVDSNDVFVWIDNYCRAHPLEDIEKAGEAFVRQHPR